jgi:hypothetical protein
MSGHRRTGSLAVDALDARSRHRNLVAPASTAAGRIAPSDLGRYAFPLGFAAVALMFALPGNLLVNLGVYSETPGGNPLTKFHPTTYMAVLAALFALYGGRKAGGMIGLFRERPALAWSFVLILTSMVFSGLNFGIGGTALYVETYLGAALVLIALETGTERQLRILGHFILTFALVNIVISVMESRVETHLIAPVAGVVDKTVEEFRGAALYSHPLTGAMVTSMVFFMVLGMHLRPLVTTAVLGVLFIGLMSFGGRVALVMTVLLMAAAALFQLSAGLVTRRLSVGFLAAFVAGSLLLPALFVVLTTTTDIGQRIVTHLYFDDSAEIRVIQWHILYYLTLHDVLFGISPDQIELFKFQIGLSKPGMDIENFWLLMYLNLGAFGFPLFVGALFLLLLHQGQRVNTPIGWLILMATLFICSTSNSLGRKSPDLIFLAAVMSALGGFRSRQMLPLAAHDAPPADRARDTGLAARPEGRGRALAAQPLPRPAGTLQSGPRPA